MGVMYMFSKEAQFSQDIKITQWDSISNRGSMEEMESTAGIELCKR